ncbi:MAG: hypothetical protein SGILL_000816 [Bacillariaceae sp.]
MSQYQQQQHSRSNSDSREQVQLKASACMSRPLQAKMIVPNVNTAAVASTATASTAADLLLPSHIMLENILDSFDHLVDARLHQYSKVLRNHGHSLSSSGAQIVEYKLRTLLEIGTNISFGSISTKFVPTGEETGDSLPVMLTLDIDSLEFHHPTTTTCQDDQSNHRLTFQAPGWFATSSLVKVRISISEPKLRGNGFAMLNPKPFEEDTFFLTHSINSSSVMLPGTFDGVVAGSCYQNVLVTDDAAAITTSTENTSGSDSGSVISKQDRNNLKRSCFTLELDCETLLMEMMEQAGEVVGKVVELTNQAWAAQQALLDEANAAAAAASETKAAEQEQRQDEPPSASKSPNLGAKKVSEVSIHQPASASASAAAASFLRGQLANAFPKAAAASDDENTNPSISAEKARHIIDYVFDEIDDEAISPPAYICVPPPAKKARIES